LLSSGSVGSPEAKAAAIVRRAGPDPPPRARRTLESKARDWSRPATAGCFREARLRRARDASIGPWTGDSVASRPGAAGVESCLQDAPVPPENPHLDPFHECLAAARAAARFRFRPGTGHRRRAGGAVRGLGRDFPGLPLRAGM